MCLVSIVPYFRRVCRYKQASAKRPASRLHSPTKKGHYSIYINNYSHSMRKFVLCLYPRGSCGMLRQIVPPRLFAALLPPSPPPDAPTEEPWDSWRTYAGACTLLLLLLILSYIMKRITPLLSTYSFNRAMLLLLYGWHQPTIGTEVRKEVIFVRRRPTMSVCLCLSCLLTWLMRPAQLGKKRGRRNN